MPSPQATPTRASMFRRQITSRPESPAISAEPSSTRLVNTSGTVRGLSGGPLPAHEFPEDPMALHEWFEDYQGAVLGQAMTRRFSVDEITTRMRNLRVSRIWWYASFIRRQDSASGTVERSTGTLRSSRLEESVPADFARSSSPHTQDTNQLYQGRAPATVHRHHYLVAEVVLNVPSSSPSAASRVGQGTKQEGRKQSNANGQIIGYLRIEGTCRPNLVFDRHTSQDQDFFLDSSSAGPPPTTLYGSGVNRATTASSGMQHVPRSTAISSTSATSSHAALSSDSSNWFDGFEHHRHRLNFLASADIESTPVPSRLREFTDEPTAGRLEDSPNSIIKPVTISSSPSNPSHAQDELLLSDLELEGDPSKLKVKNGPVGRGKEDSSPLFISPFASRSNSSTSSRTAAASDDPSSPSAADPRSNSGSWARSTAGSGSSNDSGSWGMGLNALNPGASGLGSDARDRIVVRHLEEPPTELDDHPSSTAHDRQYSTSAAKYNLNQAQGDRCVSVLKSGESDTGIGLLTLRELAVLADLVESTVPTIVHTHSSSCSDTLTTHGDVAGKASKPPALLVSSCCCEFFKRLFEVIPTVSRMGETSNSNSNSGFDPVGDDTHSLQAILSDLRSRFERRNLKFEKDFRLATNVSSVNKRRTSRAKQNRIIEEGQDSTPTTGRTTIDSASVDQEADSDGADDESSDDGHTNEKNDSPLLSSAALPRYPTGHGAALEDAQKATRRFSDAVQDVEEFMRLSSEGEM